MDKRLKSSLIFAGLAILFFAGSFVKIPFVDPIAEAYFGETVKKATIGFATATGVNSVVSVIQESELALAPAGTGVNIAIGQVLDPLDDMTERLSSVLVMAIVSLGIQRIAMEIGYVLSFKVISILFLLLIVPLWFGKKEYGMFSATVVRMIAIFFVLRLFLPVSSLMNTFIYHQFLEERIETAKAQLSVVTTKSEDFKFDDEEDTFWNKIKGAGEEITKLRTAFSEIVNNLPTILNAVLSLTMLYLTLFALQVLLIPLFMFWVLSRLVDSLFTSRFSEQFSIQKS